MEGGIKMLTTRERVIQKALNFTPDEVEVAAVFLAGMQAQKNIAKQKKQAKPSKECEKSVAAQQAS